MNLILFGAPGSGKGTQSQKLVSTFGFFQISTGDLFRAAIAGKTHLGLSAKSYMDKGELVPDSIVIGMVEEVLAANIGKFFILDGFPRTIAQADALMEMLGRRSISLGHAVFLDVPDEILLRRLTGRRVCSSCGAVFHIDTKQPQKEGVCDSCGGKLIQRSDDNELVIENRLRNYAVNTLPLMKYFEDRSLCVKVNGNQDESLVFKSLGEALRLNK